MKRSKASLKCVASKVQNNGHNFNVADLFVAYVNSVIKILLIRMRNIVNLDKINDHFKLKALECMLTKEVDQLVQLE